ncbi:TetR family transcriptional regulator [Mycobacteroides abscessus subsp. abscessus]|uniref:TetR/AcrR family transcriptional regulator n=1 Tax=Mycobacteroides abscessus TaxID=36809 RepID=UPI0009A863C4|nr:TetR/AcrR family transcriptional regulator [Mycobacteroides abscessus]SKF60014.1 TetR family transcriptional regulator [Mycobacteroides abscessus subsp. abscessus]
MHTLAYRPDGRLGKDFTHWFCASILEAARAGLETTEGRRLQVKASTRDAARTRRALLNAAARVLVTHGVNISLELVASEADVSKGGLLHHFRTREDLLVAVAVEWFARFDELVQSHLDPNDTWPGRWSRAHIRAAFDPAADDYCVHSAAIAAMLASPGVLRQVQENNERWREKMEEDGLDHQRVVLILRALDGDAFDVLFTGTRNDLDRAALRDELLKLTEQ